MAALTATLVSRDPVGASWLETWEVTSNTGAGAADEWIATTLGGISAVVGHAIKGTATGITAAFVRNALGTGGAASRGALGVETSGAAQLFVSVLGG